MSGDEESLVRRARNGDQDAFDRLVASALPKVLSVSRRMIRDEHEAWDIAQDSFFRAWRAIGEFRGGARFSTWVCGIAVRCALDRIRAARRVSPTDRVPEQTAADSNDRVELRGEIDAAVSVLPEGERSVFVMHDVGGMKYREIADELGIPLGTVMSRLHGARMKLRKALAPIWKEVNA